jgi:hypothetical protein
VHGTAFAFFYNLQYTKERTTTTTKNASTNLQENLYFKIMIESNNLKKKNLKVKLISIKNVKFFFFK